MSAKKILVVDDNTVVVKTLQMQLLKAGFTVICAQDGTEAIGVVRRERPDLIVLDINFPPELGHGGVDWNGFLIMQWLQRLEEARRTPVIVITGEAPEKYRDQALRLGAVAFFKKPVDGNSLIEAISQALTNSRDAAEV